MSNTAAVCVDQGNVEQQDAVGMVPALLLNIEPRHKVISATHFHLPL